MAMKWPTENVVAEFRDLQATTMAIDQTGCFAVLAGRKSLSIVDLDRPLYSIRKHARQSKWEVGTAEWNPTIHKREIFAITCNQRTELLTCRESEIFPQNVMRAHTRVISDLNWSPFEPLRLATCSIDTYIHIWDIRDSQKPALSLCAVAGASQVKWNKSRRHLLATSHDGDIRLWDERKAGNPVQYIGAHLSKIHGLDWSPIEGQDLQLATSSQDCTVKFWDVCNPFRPLSVISTSAPVWRARYTPFGDGLITVVVPQLRRGENSLLLWNTNSVMAPVHTFVGHIDVVLEFQWRENYDNGKDYQLVTWSKDQSLRIWQIDGRLQRLCGQDFEAEFDNNEKLSLRGLESLNCNSGNLNKLSFAASKEGDLDINSAKSTHNLASYLNMLPSRDEPILELCQSESDKTDNVESRDSLSEAVNSNLYHEFKLLNKEIRNIRIEEMDLNARTVVFLASNTIHKIWIMLKFPSSYPSTSIPDLTFCKRSNVSPYIKDEILKLFKTTAQNLLKNSQSCLEACIRAISDYMEALAGMDTKETFDVGSPYTPEFVMPLPPIKSISNTCNMIKGSIMGNIPFPRSCGATFCGVGFLVCFSKPPFMKGLKAGSEITPRSLSVASTFTGNSRNHVASSAPAYNSYMYLPVAQSPTRDSNIFPVLSLYYDRRPKTRGKLRKEDKSQKMSLVLLYDISNLLPISKDLAMIYEIDNNDVPKMCRNNITAASSVGRKDLVTMWSLISLAVDPSIVPNSDPNIGLPWSRHPFGRKLFDSLINHYLPLYDIQTVAMLCCALTSPLMTSAVKKSSSVIDSVTITQPSGKWWLKPGGSPYHTIHPGDSFFDACSLGALLKSNRSNSWSDCLDDHDSRHSISSVTDSKEFNRDRPDSSLKIVESKPSVQYDEFKRIYAEILYQWNLLKSRAEMMKLINYPITNQKKIEFTIDCIHCQSKVSGPVCSQCKNYSFQCSICRVAIKGAFNFCVICGHGGHVKHMMQWFLTENMCPTGCGCICPIESALMES